MDIVEFEENHWEELAEKFLKVYQPLYMEFVLDEYNDWMSGLEAQAESQMGDR